MVRAQTQKKQAAENTNNLPIGRDEGGAQRKEARGDEGRALNQTQEESRARGDG